MLGVQASRLPQADPWFGQLIEALPAGFLANSELQEVVDALRRFHTLEPQAAAAWGAYQSHTKTIQFTAGANQGVGRGVFSSMAGALSSAGMEILSASTDVLLDNF